MIPEIIIFAVVFFVVLASIVASINKNAQSNDSNSAQKPYVDGNGRTQAQNDYLNSLRAKRTQQQQSQRLHTDGAEDHKHIGSVEEYDKIVGSLGEITDEGCSELDGIRLISDDQAYSAGYNSLSFDRDELIKIIVLGDAISKRKYK